MCAIFESPHVPTAAMMPSYVPREAPLLMIQWPLRSFEMEVTGVLKWVRESRPYCFQSLVISPTI